MTCDGEDHQYPPLAVLIAESLQHSLTVAEQSLASVQGRIEDSLKRLDRDRAELRRLEHKVTQLRRAVEQANS